MGQVLVNTERFFGDSSPLRQANRFGGPAYEVRQEQFSLACAVARAIEKNAVLCAEAPTGVGKTFAYLVPAIYQAIEQQKTILVSTHTINLQEQIVLRDLPVLEKVMGCGPLRCELAKGRGNYLCRHHLFALEHSPQKFLPDSHEAKLLEWGTNTQDGDFASENAPALPASLRAEYSCSFENCLGRSCAFRNECHYFKVRARLAEAHVVVINHALLFSLMAANLMKEMLPPFSLIVLDEAHTIPEIAAGQFGVRCELDALKRLLLRIHNEGANGTRGAEQADIVARADRLLASLPTLVTQMTDYIHAGPDGVFGNLRRVDDSLPDCGEFALQTRELGDKIQEYALALAENDHELASQMAAFGKGVENFSDEFSVFSERKDEECAYWVEIAGRRGASLCFNAVPPEPAGALRKLLFNDERQCPVILTSATLAVRDSMAHFKSRIGAEDAEELRLDTPFDYLHQVRLYVPKMPPPPSGGGAASSPEYDFAIQEALKHFIDKTEGRALVLFTSHQQLRKCAASMQNFFEKKHYNFLMQDDSMRPAQLLQKFRKLPRAVLFGADTFWTGIDVPGEALSNVIIVKLPFMTPSHPLAEKRDMMLRARQQNPFFSFALPEAVLKFRQAFGRLIRNHTDTGMVVVLDGRVYIKPYGRIFMESIPRCGEGTD